VADQSQGVPLAMIQKLARYWMTDYDWRTCEAKLNALPQFITEIDGLDIHFIHVRSRHEDALPLIVNHGWPGSIIEQLKIIDPLVNPTAHGASATDAFHAVIPSMPGYGFSGKPTNTGWGPERMGRAWADLMGRLGYRRYVAQGGDWGAFVVDQMGLQAPAGLLAIHTNMPATVPADVDQASLAGEPPPSGLAAEERRAYEQLIRTYKQVEYARYMAARPQTLYGIADSPVGLAAWLLDHNDADGQPAAAVAAALDRTTSATGELTRDEILDNITLSWLTNTGVSSLLGIQGWLLQLRSKDARDANGWTMFLPERTSSSARPRTRRRSSCRLKGRGVPLLADAGLRVIVPYLRGTARPGSWTLQPTLRPGRRRWAPTSSSSWTPSACPRASWPATTGAAGPPASPRRCGRSARRPQPPRKPPWARQRDPGAGRSSTPSGQA
jgi:pimeloyl-ACP methyl ester carboxylesterase